MNNIYRGLACFAALTALAFGAAAKDEKKWVADAARGQKLSESLCAACHVVRPDQTRSAAAGVPSFRAMTQMPKMRILGMLIEPHLPMPNMQLTRNEIADIIAYIDDLRRKASGEREPKLTPRKKPIYPSPS